MGAVSYVLGAVLRRIGFSASRCSFFRSRRQISSRIRLGREFLLHRGAMRNSCRQLAPIMRPKVWRADSDAILVRILTAEIFLRTSVLYPWKLLAVIPAFCCIAFCKGNFLSSFLPRVFFVSLRTPSAENQLEPGSYAVLLLWC